MIWITNIEKVDYSDDVDRYAQKINWFQTSKICNSPFKF